MIIFLPLVGSFLALCFALAMQLAIAWHVWLFGVGSAVVAAALFYALLYQPWVVRQRVPKDWPRWKLDRQIEN